MPSPLALAPVLVLPFALVPQPLPLFLLLTSNPALLTWIKVFTGLYRIWSVVRMRNIALLILTCVPLPVILEFSPMPRPLRRLGVLVLYSNLRLKTLIWGFWVC